MRLNYILLPVLCHVKWQLFQSCVFCCNILPSSFQQEIKKGFCSGDVWCFYPPLVEVIGSATVVFLCVSH